MKVFTLDKVSLVKLYSFAILGVFTYILLFILLIWLITRIYPKFDNISLFLILTSIISGLYIYKFSYSNSIRKIQIKLNEKKIFVEEEEMLIENIKNIKFKGVMFNYYPKIIFEIANGKKNSFRISKNNDFEKLTFELKTNSKTKNLLKW